MNRFIDCLTFTLQQEGGYSNNPADHGGATSFGVTQAAYDAYRAAQGLPQPPVQYIALSDATAIYQANYWNAAQCSRMPAPIDLCVFDTAVNSGIERAS